MSFNRLHWGFFGVVLSLGFLYPATEAWATKAGAATTAAAVAAAPEIAIAAHPVGVEPFAASPSTLALQTSVRSDLAPQFPLTSTLTADTLRSTTPYRTVSHAFLPLFGYESDTGFAGGLLGQRFDYREGYTPYYSNIRLQGLLTTKGFFTGRLILDTGTTFGLKIRSLLTLYGDRFIKEPYFGWGNSTVYDESLWNEGYYFYERREYGLFYEARDLIDPLPSSWNTYLILLADLATNDSKASEDGGLFSLRSDDEPDLKSYAAAGFGLLVDQRDHEINPSRGFLVDVRGKWSLPGIGDVQMARYDFNVRHYVPLVTLPMVGKVVFAHQVLIAGTRGETPFWLATKLGSNDALRGVALNRFQGDASWAYMAELRSWLLTWRQAGMKIGGQFFWDSGRVFHEQRVFGEEFFKDLHVSYGFGGVIGLLNSDFILRGDFGFSEETWRLYIGAGYAF